MLLVHVVYFIFRLLSVAFTSRLNAEVYLFITTFESICAVLYQSSGIHALFIAISKTCNQTFKSLQCLKFFRNETTSQVVVAKFLGSAFEDYV